MYTRFLILTAAATCASSASAAPIGYALGNGGTTLLSFDVSSPGAATFVPLTGAVNRLDDIDFRPLNSTLYGYDDASNSYVTINLANGFTTLVSLEAVVPTGSDKLGLDFNPTIDRARVVDEIDGNIVFNPLTGGTTRFTDLFYAAGDPNEGANPRVVSNAYTNSAAGVLADSTVQYVLDAQSNTLATLANNAGTLETVGALGVDFSSDAGFDIFFDPALGNIAYALLTVDEISGLYTIDLSTGLATQVGGFSEDFGTIQGLAIAPAAIPEPTSMALVGVSAAGLFATLRRRARRVAVALA